MKRADGWYKFPHLSSLAVHAKSAPCKRGSTYKADDKAIEASKECFNVRVCDLVLSLHDY